MPKGKPVVPEGFLFDSYSAVGFPLGDYLRSMGLKYGNLATSVKTPKGRVNQWQVAGKMPYSVFEYMADHWGMSGFDMPKKELAYKRWKVAPVLGKYLGVKTEPKPDEGPPITLHDPELAEILNQEEHRQEEVAKAKAELPTSVPWDVFQSTIRMLVQHSASLLSEKQIIDDENRRLRALADKLASDLGLGVTLQRLDTVNPITPPPPTTNGPQPQQLMRQAIPAQAPAQSRALQDLESRLPKYGGPLQ